MIENENELEEGATGETGEEEADEVEGEESDEEELGETGETGEAEEAPVEKATYTIIGLVDIFDEQGNITGQYPVGSTQELTLARGDAAVEAGQATKVE